jgi:hypothetical protein
MLMLTIQKLPPERQRNTSEGLSDLFKEGHGHAPDVARAARAVIEATPAAGVTEGPQLPEVDRATDPIVRAIHRILQTWEQGLHGRLLTPDAQQQASLDAADLLQHRWFGSGDGFLQAGAGVEYDGLRIIEQSLPEPAIKAAVDLLGLGPLVTALAAHIALYRQALGLSVNSTSTTVPDWHGALQLYAASVLVAYPNEPTTRDTLMAPYTRQLAEHRADLRTARKKAKKPA